MQVSNPFHDMNPPARAHDLRLPAWGPYSKRHAGISHIPDIKAGLRFDLGVFPAFYRRRVDVPSVLWESGWHPWEATPDLSWFSNRHQLEWRDRVYCEIGFARINEHARLIRCECVNNTDMPQSLALHFMASMHFPPLGPYRDEPIKMVRPALPGGSLWIDALDYKTLRFARPRPDNNLTYENWLRGEERAHGFSGGTGLGANFGCDAGDEVSYTADLASGIADASLLLRYRSSGKTCLAVSFLGVNQLVLDEEPAQDEFGFRIQSLRIGKVPAGSHEIRIESLGGVSVALDGLVISDTQSADTVNFKPVAWKHEPVAIPGPVPNSLILKWPDTGTHYGLRWEFEPGEVRRFHCRDLESTLQKNVHNHVAGDFHGQGEGHFTNVFLRPIPLEARSASTIYGIVCSGSIGQVTSQLGEYDFTNAARLCEEIRPAPLSCTPAGSPDRFSQERMAATLSTNVVYPVYTHRSYIRHNTPGRIWDCLYTWDSGFIGLGLLEIDLSRAFDCLNAYLTPPGDENAAFVHHGTPLPVQSYLFHELWNRTQSRELLAHCYPRLLQYHGFLCGRPATSTTRKLKSGLITTWDYFYNSGGWDDYPPQKYLHATQQQKSVAPIVNTAHSIRMAKMLRMAALESGEDVTMLDRDIDELADAVQKHAWDEESGYFGYVCHNHAGEPEGILRHESGCNFNMGLDGASPLIAGICTPGQRAKLIAHLFSPGHLWTSIGLTTVDQSAPYFRNDGYWNGAVWMPHQWFFWKTMLDLGEGELAWRIARTALDLWQREVGASYNCCEHFIVQTGRGAGWHHFGGLSAPVLGWFAAYYRPGTFTTGLDVWVRTRRFNDDASGLEATLALHGTGETARCVIAVMNPAHAYQARWDGELLATHARMPGVIEVLVPKTAVSGSLTIHKMKNP